MSEMQMHRCCSGLEEEGRGTYLWYLIFLMLKPRVGLMTLVSSPLILSTMVVFPELSRPLRRTHIASHQPPRSNAKSNRKIEEIGGTEHRIRTNLRTVGNGRIGHRKGNGGRREPTPWGCASPSPCAWSSWWCWVAPWSRREGKRPNRGAGRGRGTAEQGSPRPPQAEQSRQTAEWWRLLSLQFFPLQQLFWSPPPGPQARNHHSPFYIFGPVFCTHMAKIQDLGLSVQYFVQEVETLLDQGQTKRS